MSGLHGQLGHVTMSQAELLCVPYHMCVWPCGLS
jgi:hypothetical protein